MFELVGRHRAAEQVALGLRAALLLESALVFGFDALGGHRQTQTVAQIDHGLDDGRIFVRLFDGLNEGLVDLELAQGITLEQAQRCVAGAVVVECNADAGLAKFDERGRDDIVVAKNDVLGDLELQGLGRQTGLLEQVDDDARQIAFAELSACLLYTSPSPRDS